MSIDLWIGIIVIVCVLEVIRIALSTYVLIYILEHQSGRESVATPGQAGRSLETASERARREAIVPHTLNALRDAMDEVASDRTGAQVDRAIDALDRYAEQVRLEGRR